MRDTVEVTSDQPSRALSQRLTLVTETWPPEINGVAMTLSRLVAELQTRDWQVSIVRPRQRDEAGEMPDQMLVPGLPIPGYSGLRFGLPAAGRLRQQWLAQRPDVVHVATEGPLGWSALKAAHRLKIPVTSTFHTNFHRYCSHYRLGVVRGVVARHLRNFHNATACTMAPNQDIGDTLRDDGYRNVVTLGRGVDTALFSAQRRCPDLRPSWGAEDDDLVVIHVGRLAPEKNLALVIAAFERIRARHPRARMVWVGSGPEMARLQRRHPDHIFAGPQVGEALARHYASGDLFLFPSLTETYGNVVPEAMASGLAVVAFDYAAAGLHIRHRENGVLVPFGDAQTFIDAALSLVGPLNAAVLQHLRQAASKSIRHHGWDRVAGVFEQYLRNAIQGARHVP